MARPVNNASTDRLAQQVVEAWRPRESTQLSPLQAGYAGLIPYRVAVGTQTYCLKVPLLDSTQTAAAPTARQKLIKEATRADWAGRAGNFAAAVRHTDVQRGGYLVDFLAGEQPSQEAVRSHLLPATLEAVKQLHGTSTLDVPASGPEDVNWLFDQQPADLVGNFASPLDRPSQLALVDYDAFLTHALAANSHPVPAVCIHDDLHPGNLIATPAGRIKLIDWDNLKVGDPMQDLGHLAAFTAMPADALAGMRHLYDRQGPAADPRRVALHCAFFRERSTLFGMQYGSNEAERRLVGTDLQGLRPHFASQGFTPASSVVDLMK